MIYLALFNEYVISSLWIRWKIYNSLSMAWWCLWWWNGMMLIEIYIIYHFSLWHMHCIQFIALTYRVMSWIYGSDRTGTTSFIGRNDAASYLVGYEGRRYGICIAYALWFWTMAYLFGKDIEKQCFLKAWWWSVFILHMK